MLKLKKTKKDLQKRKNLINHGCVSDVIFKISEVRTAEAKPDILYAVQLVGLNVVQSLGDPGWPTSSCFV
jgi:hypothetical protein